MGDVLLNGLGGIGLSMGLGAGGTDDGEDGEEENDFFRKDVDARSDPIVAVVYSVTLTTSAERQSVEDLQGGGNGGGDRRCPT